MKIRQTEIVIVGSGAGGGTLARELSKKDKQVTIIEAGKKPIKKLGTLREALSLYDKLGLLRSRGGIFLYRAITPGGTTVVSCGCGIRSLQKDFLKFGIDLENEFIETEQELNIAPLPEKKIKGGAQKIMRSTQELGYQMRPMPKFVNPKRCTSCGNCVLGCKSEAKWTANCYLNQAVENGASLFPETKVIKVLHSNERATGVEVIGPNGLERIMAKKIILAAGGLGTPVILQRSGVDAGRKLFCDLFNVTYGAIKEINKSTEISMALIDDEFYDSERFILSPFIDPLLQFQFFTRFKFFSREKCLGIMTKIADESIGKVDDKGNITKFATSRDQEKLNKGAGIARKILIKAGANPISVMTTSIRGAHPGGTAAIGEVINENLETKIKNLFVCDASTFPVAAGLPPILTIIALAKWLAKKLTSQEIYEG